MGEESGWNHPFGRNFPNPDHRIGELPLLTESERHQLLVEWNHTQVDYPSDIAFPSLIRYDIDVDVEGLDVKMKAYSIDLRQKIIDAYREGNISQRQLAKQFRVAVSFVQKLLKQFRETGTIAPKIRLEQTPTKLNTEQLNILFQNVAANNDATLEELRNLLEQKTGVLIGRSTMGRMLERLNITLKKKHCTPVKNIVIGCKHNEYNFGKQSKES